MTRNWPISCRVQIKKHQNKNKATRAFEELCFYVVDEWGDVEVTVTGSSWTTSQNSSTSRKMK